MALAWITYACHNNAVEYALSVSKASCKLTISQAPVEKFAGVFHGR